jgi:16S rRNA C967 or C1407 C5-methylase (RsmB/RsmF family)/NOL1/NOP2/fmu family ribosome biogenesis protein
MAQDKAPDLPSDFCRRITSQIADAGDLFEQLNFDFPVSIRVNPTKREFVDSLPEGREISWCDGGVYLKERPAFVRDPLFHAGLYYPMEASSMFLGHALKQIEISSESIILDLCAAPGGKSLILKDAFREQLLISNEIDRKRAHILKENVVRWGTQNHLVTNSDASKLASSGLRYDLILIDAPCSGEGMFRKDPNSRSEWTQERAKGCALRQNEILADALKLLNPGGYIIYSTCTFNPDENIEQLKFLNNNHSFEFIELSMNEDWAIEKMEDGNVLGYQFWPHRVQGEGFFISVLKSKEEHKDHSDLSRTKLKSKFNSDFLPISLGEIIPVDLNGELFGFTREEWYAYQDLKNNCPVVKKGIHLGSWKGKDFIPSHDLSMQPNVKDWPSAMDLNEEIAIQYLRGNAIHLEAIKGVILLTCHGLPIGFGKSNGKRINNLIPKHLRIRSI